MSWRMDACFIWHKTEWNDSRNWRLEDRIFLFDMAAITFLPRKSKYSMHWHIWIHQKLWRLSRRFMIKFQSRQNCMLMSFSEFMFQTMRATQKASGVLPIWFKMACQERKFGLSRSITRWILYSSTSMLESTHSLNSWKTDSLWLSLKSTATFKEIQWKSDPKNTCLRKPPSTIFLRKKTSTHTMTFSTQSHATLEYNHFSLNLS